MGIQISSNFTLNTALPLDDRFLVPDLAARDALPLGRRHEGMIVYVAAEETNFQLIGGITDDHWSELSGAGGGAGDSGTIVVDNFTGNGVQTTFTLSRNPAHINNTWVFIDGIYQFKGVAYTRSGSTITFVEPIPTGWNIQVVIGGTVPLGVGEDTQILVTANGLNKTLDQAITDGDIGGGGNTLLFQRAYVDVTPQIKLDNYFTITDNNIVDIISLMPAGYPPQIGGLDYSFYPGPSDTTIEIWGDLRDLDVGHRIHIHYVKEIV
jgi:hypothetical protein